MPCLIYKFVRLTTFPSDFKIEATLVLFPFPFSPLTLFISLTISRTSRNAHSYFKCKVHVYILANVFSSCTAKTDSQKTRKQTTFEFDTSWCRLRSSWVPRPQVRPAPFPHPQLPEVTVKAFSINSLSEFQYILTIWPLAKLHIRTHTRTHTLTRQIDDSLPVAKPHGVLEGRQCGGYAYVNRPWINTLK